MEKSTVLIRLKTGEHLVVLKERLILNSPVFKQLLDDLKLQEHIMDDFSPEAVEVFITLLEKESLEEIEDEMFRDLHKLATVFKIEWLKLSCREWLMKKILSVTAQEDKIFLFDECWFIMDKLKDGTMMNELVAVLAFKNNSSMLSHYLSDISKLKIGQMDVLYKLGGGNVELFLKAMLQNLRGKPTLSPKFKNLLDSINLALCFEVNPELYLKAVNTISDMAETSVNEIKYVNQLMTGTVKLVNSRSEERKERSTVVYDWRKYGELYRNCKTVFDVTKAVDNDLVTSIFGVIDLLFCVYWVEVPDREEQQIFMTTINRLCDNKKIQKVSRNYVDVIISALDHSRLEQSKLLVKLLTEIKSNEQLCTHNENFIIKRHKLIIENNNEYKHLFSFKYPVALSEACTESESKCGFILRSNILKCRQQRTMLNSVLRPKDEETNWTFELSTDDDEYTNTGIHLHSATSTKDMYWYVEFMSEHKGEQITVAGRFWWWLNWLPDITDWKVSGRYVAYDLSDYRVAKRK